MSRLRRIEAEVVAAYRREGDLLRRCWAGQCARRQQGLARDYRTRVLVNRATLLRARLAQTADATKRARIARDALASAGTRSICRS